MIRIGDKVQAKLPLYSENGEGNHIRVGTVVYIHPKKRFCRVQFQLPGGPVKETFQLANGDIQDAKVL